MFGLKSPQHDPQHAPSFYAATSNYQSNYPTLDQSIQCDVVVVGGGFSGINTALELAERGYDVVVLEANKIAWGASGRNGGQVIGGIGHNHQQFAKQIGEEGLRALTTMGWQCTDIIRQRVAKYAIDCDLKWGYADLALKPRHLRDFNEDLEFQTRHGYPHPLRMLDAQQTQQYVGSERYLGAMLDQHGAGHVHPLNLCQGEAAAANRSGARIYELTAVEKITPGKVINIATAKGQVRANYAVLAGNAYMQGVNNYTEKRVLPANSSVIATAPLGDLSKTIMPADLAVCDPRTALDYFRLSADKRLLFGGLCNYTGLEPKNIHGVMRKKMLQVYPQLADVSIDYAWSGQIGIGLNRMPQAGRLYDNLYFIQAYSGHGVAPTHMLAQVTADLICGQAERFDVFAKIKHRAWPGGRTFGPAVMALGMLYYRLLDLL